VSKKFKAHLYVIIILLSVISFIIVAIIYPAIILTLCIIIMLIGVYLTVYEFFKNEVLGDD
jgi:hypothetical protein